MTSASPKLLRDISLDTLSKVMLAAIMTILILGVIPPSVLDFAKDIFPALTVLDSLQGNHELTLYGNWNTTEAY